MEHHALIDVAVGQEPNPGEKFYISLQENSEMLGLLDGGRTFRFKSASDADKRMVQKSRVLRVLHFQPVSAGRSESRREGTLTTRGDGAKALARQVTDSTEPGMGRYCVAPCLDCLGERRHCLRPWVRGHAAGLRTTILWARRVSGDDPGEYPAAGRR
jgi:hypothetical protein